MKIVVASAVALMALAGTARAADTPVASLMTVKIGVTDFYVKFLGMKAGAQYNPAEKAVDWPTPGQGSNLILVNDATGKIKLTLGGGWLLFKVPDAGKIGKAMADAGFKVDAPVEMKETHWRELGSKPHTANPEHKKAS